MADKQLKRGNLSNEEMDFIKDNVKGMSIKDIAKHLNKNAEIVKKYAYNENLIATEEYENASEKMRAIELRNKLHKRDYFDDLKKQFSAEELKKFESYWIKTFIQFDDDVLALEEFEVKQYITLEILKDRMLRYNQEVKIEIDQLNVLVNEEYKKPAGQKNVQAIKDLKAMIEPLEDKSASFLKEFRDFTDKQASVTKDLKVSRGDRIKNIQDATQNWTSVIRLLNENAAMREKVGKHIEIMKAASINQDLILGEFHAYIDGNVDIPILCAENMEKVKEED